MVPSIRKQFNQNFTKELYEKYLHKLHNTYQEGALAFRVAETPVLLVKNSLPKFWMLVKVL